VLRPVEYEKLLKVGVVIEASPSASSISQFMQNAQEFAAAAKAGLEVAPRFTLAYEGTLDVAMAVLEFRGVRPGDTGRCQAMAVNRVAADLGLNVAKQNALTRLLEERDRVTYRQPIPPLTAADAAVMHDILDEMLAVAMALIGGQGNSKT
jgi:hypothetical protein